MTTASSTSQSVFSEPRGMMMTSSGPVIEVVDLAKTIGSVGGQHSRLLRARRPVSQQFHRPFLLVLMRKAPTIAIGRPAGKRELPAASFLQQALEIGAVAAVHLAGGEQPQLGGVDMAEAI